GECKLVRGRRDLGRIDPTSTGWKPERPGWIISAPTNSGFNQSGRHQILTETQRWRKTIRRKGASHTAHPPTASFDFF
ncbi:MAG: hypothetical protein MIO92_12140, partial [Methanosarcinaceae archaeon]|nr:hypothetical protein [Methanosarcinaceae archaeon]